ncbi:hypothetical protein L6452_21696 [Arctium lappa]|uniref:Uncharacterized protein n=1 Tax=Arctium lappa TaxID=4217 RepID=A0ACB9AX62_ARCLA|nr:hypothetical protein L6452_21696 [Arctium lappa]
MAGNEETNSNKTDGGSISSDSPYYIHASDYPRQMQVNEALSDGNYIDWSQEMLNFLFAKNKVGFIDGSIKKPEPNTTNYMAWMRCDAMIKGWLNTAMEKDIRTSVKYANTAQEIWEDLQERFGKESAPRAYELKQSLTTIRQDSSSVSSYYTKFRSLWDEIQSVLPIPKCSCNGCTCGLGKRLVEVKEKEQLYEFLLGLDGDFGTIRTQILAMKPTPSLGTAYHLVAEDEQQRAISSAKKPAIEPAAFQSYVPGKRDSNQQTRSVAKGGKRGMGEPDEHCNFCGKDGHNREGCFKRIGYPDWWPGKGKQDKPKRRAAFVGGEQDRVPNLTNEQYQKFLNFLGNKGTNKEEALPVANMTENTGCEVPNIDPTGKRGKVLLESRVCKSEFQMAKPKTIFLIGGFD